MLRLSDSVICRKRFYNQSGGSILQLWDTAGIQNTPSSVYKQNLFILSWLSDLVVCSPSLYIWSRGSVSQV